MIPKLARFDNSINLALVNHNKTACFKLQKVDGIVCNDSGKRESRQDFYVRLIREIEDDIYKMDRATTTIEKYINDSGQTQFQVKLLEELIKLWKE